MVDGTGVPGKRADVGIAGGRVVTVGEVDDSASRTIDADGLVVAPGFVDIHTHYDAQVFWDGGLTPSSIHGVTTVVGGNCGFSIAPLTDDSGEYLMNMLARVEGMPLDSLRQGCPWDWRSFADYLDALTEGVNALNTGDPLDEAVRMGPMVRAQDAARVNEWIAEAVAGGARTLAGGEYSGAMHQATVVADVRPEMRISSEELFGPAVAVTPFSDIDEAIEMANDTPYGLSAAIFTQNIDWSMKFAREVDSGNLQINAGPQWRALQPLPAPRQTPASFRPAHRLKEYRPQSRALPRRNTRSPETSWFPTPYPWPHFRSSQSPGQYPRSRSHGS